MIVSLWLYPLVGMAAGLSAGLFGVGGGLVIVPALVLCFSALSVSESILMPLAIGTSLASIVVTSLSSVWAHHKLKNVNWRVWIALSPGIVLGVVFGVNTVTALPASALKLAFGLFVIAVAIQMAVQLPPPASRVLPRRPTLAVAGLVIGYISALFGIGGGSLTVPFLSFCNVSMRRAVATAAACGLPIAVAGMVSNILVGLGDARLPEYSTGFVYWPAFLGIVVFSVPVSKIGAGLAQRLSSLVLKRIFSGFLFMVGIFFFWGA